MSFGPLFFPTLFKPLQSVHTIIYKLLYHTINACLKFPSKSTLQHVNGYIML